MLGRIAEMQHQAKLQHPANCYRAPLDEGPSMTKQDPLVVELENVLQESQKNQSIKAIPRTWPRPLGIVGRLVTYAGVFFAWWLSRPHGILTLSYASLNIAMLFGTTLWVASGLFLLRCLFRPSDQERSREAWDALGLLILCAIASGAVYQWAQTR